MSSAEQSTQGEFPPLDPEQEPELFRFLDGVARGVRAFTPARVVCDLSDRIVLERGRGSALRLGLLRVAELDQSELGELLAPLLVGRAPKFVRSLFGRREAEPLGEQGMPATMLFGDFGRLVRELSSGALNELPDRVLLPAARREAAVDEDELRQNARTIYFGDLWGGLVTPTVVPVEENDEVSFSEACDALSEAYRRIAASREEARAAEAKLVTHDSHRTRVAVGALLHSLEVPMSFEDYGLPADPDTDTVERKVHEVERRYLDIASELDFCRAATRDRIRFGLMLLNHPRIGEAVEGAALLAARGRSAARSLDALLTAEPLRQALHHRVEVLAFIIKSFKTDEENALVDTIIRSEASRVHAALGAFGDALGLARELEIDLPAADDDAAVLATARRALEARRRLVERCLGELAIACSAVEDAITPAPRVPTAPPTKTGG